MSRRTVTRVLLLLVGAVLVSTSVLAQQVAGQKPVLLIGDQFQFTPGTWATYILHDKREDAYSTMTMAVLESVRHNGRDSAWLEIIVETATELVVTRLLTEKTPSGPGEVFEAIVYVHGLQPFRIPQRWLKGEEQEVGKLSNTAVTSRVGQRRIMFDGRPLDVIDVDAVDESGARVVATVSTGVAPIGVLTADSRDVGMYLEDWGSGATTRIVGTPVSFVEWTATMVARGLSGKDVSLPSKPGRLFDMTGVWREADGPCAGSQWTVTGAHPTSTDLTANRRCGGDQMPVMRTTRLTWRSDRILTFDVPDTGRETTHLLLAFTSPSRGLVVFVDRAGRRTVATLRR